MAEKVIKEGRGYESNIKDKLNIASAQCLVFSKEIEQLRDALAKSESQELNLVGRVEDRLLELQKLKDSAETKGPKVYLRDFISYFSKNELLRHHLLEICRGKIVSERHNLFKLKNYHILYYMTNSKFFEPEKDIKNELLNSARKLCPNDRYCNSVFIPEGILFYLTREKKMSPENAQKYYLESKESKTFCFQNHRIITQKAKSTQTDAFNNLPRKRSRIAMNSGSEAKRVKKSSLKKD